MEYRIVEDAKNRFLRLKTEVLEENFEGRMLLNNRPEGLLRMHPVEDSSGTFYDYNITGLVSLKDCEREVLLGNYLRAILFRLETLSEVLYEYMLSPSKIRLQEEMIFLNRETGRVFFLYDPSKEETLQNSLERMMEYFLKKLNPSEEKEVLLLYGLYAKSREPNVSMGTLAEYWRDFAGIEQEIREEPESEYASDDELRIYEELGMETPMGRRKENGGNERGGEAGNKKWLAGPGREADETVEEPLEVSSGVDLFQKETGRGGIDRLKDFLKTYSFEIVVGIIVLGGTVAILLR